MLRTPRVGLLPFYISLYDAAWPGLRNEFRGFIEDVGRRFERAGIEVMTGGICCVASEFRAAVAQFEATGADAIVTLHLAYSPSEEAVGALVDTHLPIVLLDTTMDYSFGHDAPAKRLMYNHGIHGVQDLASVLRRRQRRFEIVAGHIEHSNVIARAADLVRGAVAAAEFRGSSALRIGETFAGMGDFNVPAETLEAAFGITVRQISFDDLVEYIEDVGDDEVSAEMQADRERFRADLPEPVHRRSVQVGLGLRRYLDDAKAAAMSVNFLAAGKGQVMPFLEIGKAMSRGVGYAGEGDVLTAALVGALIRAFHEVTFTEIFCPDWQGQTLFLSHMGEINPAVAADKPRLIEKEFPYTEAENPAFIACAPRPGGATLVNLAPGPNGAFRLLAAPVEVQRDSERPDFQRMVRGWIKPTTPVARFLESYSRLGGTHHSALMLGEHTEALQAFAGLVGIEYEQIR